MWHRCHVRNKKNNSIEHYWLKNAQNEKLSQTKIGLVKFNHSSTPKDKNHPSKYILKNGPFGGLLYGLALEHFLKPQKVGFLFKHKMKLIWEKNFYPPSPSHLNLYLIYYLLNLSVKYYCLQKCAQKLALISVSRISKTVCICKNISAF